MFVNVTFGKHAVAHVRLVMEAVIIILAIVAQMELIDSFGI